MSVTAAGATFLAVLPAEIPDKTILACLILSSRYRPIVVFGGAATAFLAQVIISVAAGGALSLLPHRIVGGGVQPPPHVPRPWCRAALAAEGRE